MKELAKYTTFGAVCLSFALCGHAGEFNVVCSYTNENLKKCASIVSDVITDKFTTKFSTKKFSIFAYSDIHSYSNGGYAAYAVVGVVPRGSGEFPVKHFPQAP